MVLAAWRKLTVYIVLRRERNGARKRRNVESMGSFSPRWVGAFSLAAGLWLAGAVAGYAFVDHLASVVHQTGAFSASDEVLDGSATATQGPSAIAVDAEQGNHAPSASGPAGPLLAGPDPTRHAALATFIFRRNVTVYVWMLFGLLSAGAITFAVTIGNGFMLGQVIGMAIGNGATGPAIAALLVPHGVLELGTFCIAGAVGFQGLRLALHWKRTGWQTVRELRLGLVIAFGLGALAVAAVLETYITAVLAMSMPAPR